MNDGPTRQRAVGASDLRMPKLYGAAVSGWAVTLLLVLIAAAYLYYQLIESAVAVIASDVKRGHLDVVGTLLFPILCLITAAGLLIVMIKVLFTSSRPSAGIRRGSFPSLEGLVSKCAKKAEVCEPDALDILPEANAYAWSSGLFASSKRLSSMVIVGAPLLLCLEREDLAAVLYHEFGHIYLRRRQWAVYLENKVHNFLIRFKNAQATHVNGYAWLFGFVPRWMFGLFEMMHNRAMAWFTRQEEFLVDRFAASLMEEGEFAGRLTRAITFMQALHDLSLEIDAEFHRLLMSMNSSVLESGAPEWPNYFEVVRNRLPDLNYPLARDILEKQKTKAGDSHPSMTDRVRNLGSDITDYPTFPNNRGNVLEMDDVTERFLSAEFGTRLRSAFFRAKVLSNLPPEAGLEEGGVAVYTCLHSRCPRFGKPELVISREGIAVMDGKASERFHWGELVSVSVKIGGGPNVFMVLCLAFFAAFWEMPLNRMIILVTEAGRKVKISHWHLKENLWEVEALVERFAKRTRVAAKAKRKLWKRSIKIAVRLTASVAALVVVAALLQLVALNNGKEIPALKDIDKILELLAMYLGWSLCGKLLARWK